MVGRKITELHLSFLTDATAWPHVLYALDEWGDSWRLVVGGLEDFVWPGKIDQSKWEKLPRLPEIENAGDRSSPKKP